MARTVRRDPLTRSSFLPSAPGWYIARTWWRPERQRVRVELQRVLGVVNEHVEDIALASYQARGDGHWRWW